MIKDIGRSIRKHNRILIFAVALAVISLYMIPFDELGALAKKSTDTGKDKPDTSKNNNCENGLPPHKNGNSDNGNHYGCLKHL